MENSLSPNLLTFEGAQESIIRLAESFPRLFKRLQIRAQLTILIIIYK
jgi:hypothetical protein